MGCQDGTDRSECLIDSGQRGSMTTVRSSTLKDLMPDVGPSCRSRSSKIDLMRLESTSACVEDNPGWQMAVSNEALLHASDDKETNLCNCILSISPSPAAPWMEPGLKCVARMACDSAAHCLMTT